MEKVWELIDRNAIVVCADHEQATHWADVAPAEYRAHAVTGLTRTAALLKEGRIGLLAGSPADLAALVARSALKLDTLEALVIGWPKDVDVVVATTLPTREELQALIAIAPQPVVLALASQLPYLRSIAALTPLSLPSGADRAQDRSSKLRAQITERLSGDLDAELAALAPLFEEHDPAMVAAALLAISRQPSAGNIQPREAEPGTAWMKIFVTVGTKDRASAKDLVGALIKEAGLQKRQIGKIDVRETFSLVEVSPPSVDQAVQRLSGVSIRGRRITARPDRG